MGVGVLAEEGGDGLAGAAPGGVRLEGDVRGGFDELVELSFGGDIDDGHFVVVVGFLVGLFFGGLVGERSWR